MQVKTTKEDGKFIAVFFSDDGIFKGQSKRCKDQKQLQREIDRFKRKHAEV